MTAKLDDITTTANPKASTTPAPRARRVATGPRHLTFSLDRYHAMIEAGVLDENDRAELIYGNLIEKMPVGDRHVDCVNKINVYFVVNFSTEYTCSPQNPIVVPPNSEPGPDYALESKEMKGGGSGKAKAEHVPLVIEVSDSTLAYDRGAKAELYAFGGIEEYWIINLQEDKLELHLSPDKNSGSYNSIQRFGKDDKFTSPLCGEVQVADLLPPPSAELMEEE